MNTMTCKGKGKDKSYTAWIEYSDEDECFVGHITGIKDRIGFHGKSVAALRGAFEEAVEDYLETCKAVAETPEEPCLPLGLPPGGCTPRGRFRDGDTGHSIPCGMPWTLLIA